MLRTPFRKVFGHVMKPLVMRDFSPKVLFSNGEIGAWYDPSDLTTVFTDADANIPASVGDPIALILDKSKDFALGSELVTNGTFDTDTSGWSVTSGNGTIASSGGELVGTCGSTGLLFSSPITTVVGKLYKLSVEAARGTFTDTIQIGVSTSSSSTPSPRVEFTNSLPKQTKEISFTASATTTYVVVRLAAVQDGATIFLDNVSVKEISGNHARQNSAASRPILRQAGGGQYYLEFDGTDDFLVTSNIDFSGTDQMSAFAGVRKLSDASTAQLIEFSISTDFNNGTFFLRAPSDSATNAYAWRSRGTVSQNASVSVAAFPAPISNVVTGIGDISNDISILRVNGKQVSENNGNQGTGNYGNYPLYIGRRAGTSLPFNGHIYSLIVRGILTSGRILDDTEEYVAGRMGIKI